MNFVVKPTVLFVTLKTQGKHSLSMSVKSWLSRQQSDKIWHTLSNGYADDASGVITAFSKNVPDDWKPKTIFWKTDCDNLDLIKMLHILILGRCFYGRPPI